MKPYWEGDGIALYHGRCEDVLLTITPESVDALLTDPPYFQVKDDDWDNQWDKAAEFLEWLGEVTDLLKPSLRPHASVWMFCGPLLATSVESVVGKRFNVLNTVRWVKDSGMHKRNEITALRRFLTAWEGIIFAEQFGDKYEDASDSLHREVFAPIGDYIRSERERAGLSRRQVSSQLVGYKNADSANANIFNWELGKNLIGERDYAALAAAMGAGYLTRDYKDLRREFEDLRREFEDLRRPFNLTKNAGPVTDVWNFNVVQGYPGKHPCEKPAGLLRHMIESTTRPGAVILDCFAGSGSTLIAARDTGRKAIGIEMDERWCEHAARKLDQGVLDFGELA